MGKGCPIPQDMRQNILDDLDMGYSYADISDRYGVSYSTIRRIQKRSPETPTAMENVPEDITADNNISTYSISEVHEVVKPELDYEEQKAYIADILKAALEDISEEVRSFEERIQQLQDCLEERRKKQSYLRDFIRSMK